LSGISINFDNNIAKDDNQLLVNDVAKKPIDEGKTSELSNLLIDQTIQSDIESSPDMTSSEEVTNENSPDDSILSPNPLTWLDYARQNNFNKVTATGSLEVHAQVAGANLVGAYVEVVNSTGYVVATDKTDINGNSTVFNLEEATYTVIVNQTTNFTTSITVSSLLPNSVIATFGYLNITTQNGAGSTIPAIIELRNNIGVLLRDGLATNGNGLLNVTVATGTYNIYAHDSTYGQTKNGITVTEGITSVLFQFGDITGKFGGLYVKSTGFMDMPMVTNVKLYYYSTGTLVSGGSINTIATTGTYTWTGIAPDVYKVVFTESSTDIIYDNVQISENVQTNLSASFGTVVIYQDNTTNTLTEIFHEGASTRFTYGFISTTTKLITWILAPGNYRIDYSGQSHFITVSGGEKIEINNHTNTNPTRIDVTANPTRINANESTNLTIKMFDVNYDYDTVNFDIQSNIGSISSQWIRFTSEEEYTSTINYTAPMTIQTMYIDINVTDGHNGSFTFRIYVSNQVGTIVVNSTIFGGPLPSTTLIEIWRVHLGTRLTYTWVNTTGYAVFNNIIEDEYYLRAHEQNIQTTTNFLLAGGDVHLHNFKWATLKINSTGLNNQLIDTPIRVQNQGGGISTNSQQTTVLTGNGYQTWYLAEGTYFATATEANLIYKYDMVLTAEQETYYEFKFGVAAVYFLDSQGNPASALVELYNGTDIGSPRFTYTWTSASTGFVVLILAPDSNYTIRVDSNNSLHYINIQILPNQGVYVGQFVNHAPTINTYSASPSTVLPNQTTTITIVATDPDVLDILTYIYEPSIGTIVGSGSVVNYTAPVTFGFYYLNISVVDTGGLYNNITRMLSTRTVSIAVHVQDSQGLPIYNKLVELFDWTKSVRLTYSWTNTGGNYTFSNVLESFYYIQVTGANIITVDTFKYAADVTIYNITVTFGLLYVNAKSIGNALESSAIKVYDNQTDVQQSSATSYSSGDGYYRFELRPGGYDVTATEINIQTLYDINVQNTGTTNLTFNWAVINVTQLSHHSMPIEYLVELYNTTSNTRITYGWGDQFSGQIQFIVREDNEYQIRVNADNSYVENVTTIPNQQYDVIAEFGVIRVTRTDGLGNPVPSINYQVFNQSTLSLYVQKSTNTNGQVFFTVIPGEYKVESPSLITFNNVIVNPLQRTDLGDSYNNIPSVLSIYATPSRIGPNSNTTVRIEIQDANYDYGSISVNFVLSTGSIGVLREGWIRNNQYFFEVPYFSSSISELYQINITIDDGSGGLRDYMLVVSNIQTTLHVHSLSGLFQGITTTIRVFRHNDNVQVSSQNTNANGLTSFVLYDDYYYIQATEQNIQYIYNVWVKGGETVNKTFYWGEMFVYSTGVGGVPLANTLVEVFYQSGGARITYGWTNTQGLISFILKPEIYRVVLTQTSTIEFQGIEILEGDSLNLGSNYPSVTKPNDFSFYYDTTGNTVSWTLSHPNPGFYNISVGGTFIVFGTPWIDGEVITLNLDSLPLGVYVVIINVNTTTGYTQSDAVIITVVNNAPVFNTNPIDFSLEEGTTGNSITWITSDQNKDSYLLFRNSVLIASGIWTTNSLNFNIDGLARGNYTYELVLNDTLNIITSDIVVVTVVNDIPKFVSKPADKSYEIGSTGNTISWTITDLNPDTYLLYRNSVLIASGPWFSNNGLNIQIDGLVIGNYTFDLYVNDTDNAISSDSVIINVSNYPPKLISSTSDYSYELASTNHFIMWTFTDQQPDTYLLYRNSVLIDYGTWLSNNGLSFNIDGLALGSYTFEIIVNDTYNVITSDSVTVSVINDNPKFTIAPADFTYAMDSTGHNISWTITDQNPDSYLLYRDSVLIDSGTWVSNVALVFDIDGLVIGTYIFDLYVNDTDNVIRSDSVTVTVISSHPQFIVNATDFTYQVGSTGNKISWTLTDDVPDKYMLFRDGTLLFSGSWISSSKLTFNVDGLAIGVYTYELVANDSNNEIISNTVVVTVVNDIPSFTSIPSDTSYEFNTTGNSLSWTIKDQDPESYLLYQNSVLISSGSWESNTAITISIDGLALGSYTFELIVNDTHGEIASDTVILTVVNSPPSLNSPADLSFEAGKTGNQISWTAIDTNPDNYKIFKNNILIQEGKWASNSPIIISVDELLTGTYNLKIVVYDTLGNSTNDLVVVTVTAPPSPLPDHTASITQPDDITYYTNDTSKLLAWKPTYTHASGVKWRLLVDKVEKQTGGVLSNTFYIFNISNLNLKPGLHTITFEITIEDLNGDQFVYKDSVAVNVIYQNQLNSGNNKIDLEGESTTNIEIDVDSSVEVTITTSTEINSTEGKLALVELKQVEGLIDLSYHIDIKISDNSALNGVWINISYVTWNLTELNIDESSLKIYFFNENTNKWEPAGNTGVDMINKVIYAHVDHLTAFAAVAAVYHKEVSSSNSNGFSTGTSTSKPAPASGFTLFALLLLVAIPIIRKRKY
jgi:hypothetical protein